MFICAECLPESQRWLTHLVSSYGPCEVCKVSKICADV